MPKSKTIVLTAVLASLLCSGRVAHSMDLNQFQWKNRLLLVFAPMSSDALFSALNSEISGQPHQISDRDLIVFRIFESGTSYMGTTQLDVRFAAALREQFAVPPGVFACILMGKDGGLKLRQNTPVRLRDIFGLIDSMPVRRDEMRRKSEGGFE